MSISFDRKRQLDTFQAKFAEIFQFRDILLLNESLTHDSCRDRSGRPVPNFERLEWLGDAIIKFVLSAHLFVTYSNDNEGQLTNKRVLLESNTMLNQIARDLVIERYVQTGPGNVQLNGYADFVEALIGAIYVDARRSGCNWEPIIRSFMAKYWVDPHYGRRIDFRHI